MAGWHLFNNRKCWDMQMRLEIFSHIQKQGHSAQTPQCSSVVKISGKLVKNINCGLYCISITHEYWKENIMTFDGNNSDYQILIVKWSVVVEGEAWAWYSKICPFFFLNQQSSSQSFMSAYLSIQILETPSLCNLWPIPQGIPLPELCWALNFD